MHRATADSPLWTRPSGSGRPGRGLRPARPLREGAAGTRGHRFFVRGVPLCRDDGPASCSRSGPRAVPVAGGPVAPADGLAVLLSACGMNVHHRCQTKVANLCGINQKLMAEALAMIESTQQVGTLAATSSPTSGAAGSTAPAPLISAL